MAEPDEAGNIHPADRHSPFHRLIGWSVTEWGNGRAVITCDIRPDFMNRGGNLHGGLVATLIDAAAGYAALGGPGRLDEAAARGPLGATLSLTVNYLGTARQGRLTVTAERSGGGRTIAFVRIAVTGPDGAMLAEGMCTYRLFAPAS